MTTKVYRIKLKDAELYSTGGSYPRWNKTGKIWTGIGPLKNHLNIVYGKYGANTSPPLQHKDYNWEIIEYVLEQTYCKSQVFDGKTFVMSNIKK